MGPARLGWPFDLVDSSKPFGAIGGGRSWLPKPKPVRLTSFFCWNRTTPRWLCLEAALAEGPSERVADPQRPLCGSAGVGTLPRVRRAIQAIPWTTTCRDRLGRFLVKGDDSFEMVHGGFGSAVGAINAGAAAFYQHHDFQPLPNRPDRLAMKLSTAASALGLDRP